MSMFFLRFSQKKAPLETRGARRIWYYGDFLSAFFNTDQSGAKTRDLDQVDTSLLNCRLF